MEWEGNDLTYKNLAYSAPSWDNLVSNNYPVSDELKAPAVYRIGSDTEHAKSHRKLSKKATTILTISIVGLAGGIAISSALAPVMPSLAEGATFDYDPTEQTLEYAFTIVNPKRYQTTFQVMGNGEVFYALDVRLEQTYQGTVNGLDPDKTYELTLSATNGFDYWKTVTLVRLPTE